ncbi:hypothetical protein HBH69_025560 [Parastagonospora nodorum]|nr:hypothetical protein HBH42_039480 [Parastagonospora nodorum]KAH4995437.1 hypothetical protein HBI76_009270 [Parastagonospora nodorum]KAH5162011.1 hypothetical protein HBH69_025560 [Parastagonospora nodorum]KAH5704698.1 hypothetical protein HBI44_009660 [Parastagonospora nodorum]KAH5773821.1 hypothetical protein HBI17_004040 [Parastagonospora nodorum]
MAIALDVGSESASTQARAARVSTATEDNCATHGDEQRALLNAGASALGDLPLTTPKKISHKLRAWRKLVEAVHPSRCKVRRARESDAIMREMMESPVGDNKEWENGYSTEGMLREEEEYCSATDTTLSLEDELEYVQPQEADEEITALLSIPTFLVTQKKNEARITIADEVGVFRSGAMWNGESRYGKKEKEVVRMTARDEIGLFGAGAMWNGKSRRGKKEGWPPT